MNDKKPQADNGASGPQPGNAPQTGNGGFEADVKARFLAAAGRAKRINAAREEIQGLRRETGRRKWMLAAAAAAVIAVCVWVGMGMVGRDPLSIVGVTPAVADEFLGLSGIVISSHDRSPLPGIEIKQQFAGGNPEVWEYVITTNAMGLFDIPTDERGARTIGFLQNSVEKTTLLVGGDAGLSGDIEVKLDIAPVKGCFTYPVTLMPGEDCEPFTGLRVRLDSTAERAWEGELIHNLQWPSNFIFGNVLAGVFSLEGPACDGLRLAVEINAAIPRMYQFDPDDLSIITHSEKYRSLDDLEHESWRPKHHRGWYSTSLITPEKARKYDLQRVKPSVMLQNESLIVDWPTVVGLRYAIKTPVLSNGEIVACVHSFMDGDDKLLVPAIGQIKSTHVQPMLYDPLYTPPGINAELTKTGYMPRGVLMFQLNRKWVEDHNVGTADSYPKPLKDDEFKELPGTLKCRLHDFTIDGYLEYPIDTSNLTEPLGDYDIEVSSKPMGGKLALQVTGSTHLLECPPQWDFHMDGVTDSYGLTAGLLIPDPGTYYYRVILKERNGPYIVVDRVFTQSSDEYMGFFRCSYSILPVCKPQLEPPNETHTHRALSRYSVTSPMAYCSTVSLHLGPWIYVDPPPEWDGTRLSELRIFYKVRATSAGATEMEIYSNVFAVTCKDIETADGPTHTFLPIKHLPPLMVDTGRIDINNYLSIPYYAILEADKPISNRTAHEVIDCEIEKNPYTATIYKRLFNLDIYDIPPEDELVALLRLYVESPECGIHECSFDFESITPVVDLSGITLGDSQGFLINYFTVDGNMPKAGQWEVVTGGEDLPRAELISESGEVYTVYFDYSCLSD